MDGNSATLLVATELKWLAIKEHDVQGKSMSDIRNKYFSTEVTWSEQNDRLVLGGSRKRYIPVRMD